MVTFQTNHGDIVIKTFDDKAPKTVQNFLDYCREGFYDNTIFHRVINGFMIQGGGFEPGMKQKETKADIQNEANNGLKNTKGTLAMARTSAPHSATAQFFINVADNDFLNFRDPESDRQRVMSRTLFIADLHLCQEEPAITAGFLHFLQREAPHCDALYILGDLFEAWIGDDDPDPLHQQIALALRALPVPVYFIHGNRDFLIGRRFARASGLTLLPEEQVLTLYGHRLLIMHGDTLCTDDAGYLRFRAKVHTPWIQRLFLALPLRWRKRIAARMRADSQQANQHKSQTIMDVNPQAVATTMLRQQVPLLIHGHTHRPAIHTLSLQGQTAQRAVLGAWHQRGSMIQLDERGIQLIEFDF